MNDKIIIIRGGSEDTEFTPRYVIIKMAKVNGKILREAKEKQLITYKRNAIRLSADFLAETLQAITG